MKKLLLALGLAFGLATSTFAQVTVPNTLVAGHTILSADLNTNFTTLGNHALDRLSGGSIQGNVTVAGGVTIDGVQLGTQVCTTCNATFSSLSITNTATALRLVSTNTSATSLTVGGGITAGTGVVGIVDTTGKIPALNATYFTSVSGTSLTGVGLLASNNTWSARNDFLNYTEKSTSPSISANVLTLDLSGATHFIVALNANITTLTISNTPGVSGGVVSFTVKFTADGTLRTITWPASVKWPGGSAPTMTSTNLKVDVFAFLSYDQGTTWYAFASGQNF